MNRILLVFILLVAFEPSVSAQYKEQTQAQKQALYKVERYGKLKRTGFTLLGIGAGVAVVSIAMISSADWTEDPYTGQIQTDDSSGLLGVVGLVYLSVPLIATGTTLAIIGNKKEKSYLNRYDRLNANYFQKGNFKGISLTYNF